ncbi:MAG: pitrilysin family protein [Acidobacteriota bacterium]
MKKLLITLFLVIALFVPAGAQQPTLKLPTYKKVKLANGMTLLLMEQHEVPFVSFSMIIRAGSVVDPVGKEGVASLTAEMLRKGTKTRNAEQIAKEVDFVGGSLDFSAAADYSSGTAEFLKNDLSTALDLLGDLLMNPTFPENEFDKMRKQRIDGIKQAKDQAMAVMPLYFTAYTYGTHPYARPTSGDERSVAAITRADLVKHYESYYAPSNIILAVAGDFSTAELERSLSERFSNWKKSASATVVKPTEPQPFKGRKLLFVDKPDSTQTFFMIGNVGVSRTNPDRVGINIINTFFGGRFTSLLNNELRVKSGLTYGARSFFDRRLVAGPFAISTYTRNATTEQAIDMALDVLKRLHENGLTEEELKSTKEYIKGQYAPNLETSGQLAGQLVLLEFYSLDEREINSYFTQIDAFTMADARRIIKQYFPLENLVFVLIGKAEETSKVAKKYAPKMDTKQISQPGFN